MPERILAFPDALAEVLAAADSLGLPARRERRSLTGALGCVLAEPVVADRDQPPFPRSTRDGYAVRSADLAERRELRVLGTIAAGSHWPGPALTAGEAVSIMTGAPVPPGTDAVLMVEHASLHGDHLQPEAGRRLRAGENVIPQGAEARLDQQLLPIGQLISAAEVAVAASCGCRELTVFTRPRVAIVATGDELVPLEETPGPSQIRNSNTWSLAAMATAEDAAAQPLPITRDTLESLRASLAAAETADLLLLSGGVSMGQFDLVEQALTEAAAEFVFTGALIQPGKPVVFGHRPRRDGSRQFFFGLPGNPVSTQVCFHLFVAPFLRALAGRSQRAPQFAEARLTQELGPGTRVTRFLPAELTSHWQGAHVRLVGWQGSGDVAANARANCYAVLPAGHDSLPEGSTVRILLR